MESDVVKPRASRRRHTTRDDSDDAENTLTTPLASPVRATPSRTARRTPAVRAAANRARAQTPEPVAQPVWRRVALLHVILVLLVYGIPLALVYRHGELAGVRQLTAQTVRDWRAAFSGSGATVGKPAEAPHPDDVSEPDDLSETPATSELPSEPPTPPAPPAPPALEPQEAPRVRHIRMDTLRESDVFCYGENSSERVCRIQNLCYLPQQQRFVVVVSNSTVMRRVPRERLGRLVELTNLLHHPQMYWDFGEIMVDDPRVQNVNVDYHETKTFMANLFHHGNVMHMLHDSAFNFYWLMREFGDTPEPGSQLPFSLDNQFLLLDGRSEGDVIFVMKYFTQHPLLSRRDLAKPNVVTCFADAVIGSSKRTSWYQYGFRVPQGPIPNKTVNGWHVRAAAEFLERRAAEFRRQGSYHLLNSRAVNATVDALAAASPYDARVHDSERDVIVIFSRLRERLVLNEAEVAAALERRYRLRAVFLRMESHPFETMIATLQRARIVVGMHGSMLILGVFCRPGTVLVEMFPYAVPSENYTPYRTMSGLEGVSLAYRAWENKHPDRNVPHPEYAVSHGGLETFPPEKRAAIEQTLTVPTHLCCSDPYWLYRIYQDTNVTVTELFPLIDSALAEADEMRRDGRPARFPRAITPAAIEFVHCRTAFDEARNETTLVLRWHPPWNLHRRLPEKYTVQVNDIVEMDIYDRVQKETAHVQASIVNVKQGDMVTFRIRSILDGVAYGFSRKTQCVVGSAPGPGGVHLMDRFDRDLELPHF